MWGRVSKGKAALLPWHRLRVNMEGTSGGQRWPCSGDLVRDCERRQRWDGRSSRILQTYSWFLNRQLPPTRSLWRGDFWQLEQWLLRIWFSINEYMAEICSLRLMKLKHLGYLGKMIHNRPVVNVNYFLSPFQGSLSYYKIPCSKVTLSMTPF